MQIWEILWRVLTYLAALVGETAVTSTYLVDLTTAPTRGGGGGALRNERNKKALQKCRAFSTITAVTLMR